AALGWRGRYGRLVAEGGRRDPETQELGDAALEDLLRRDRVAERLVQLAAAAVGEEAVRGDDVVGGAARDRDAGEQRAVEPAAVLVAALEVEVGAAAQLGPALDHRLPAHPRVEPHVQDVGLGTERRAAAAGAAHAGRHQLADRAAEPRVRTLALEDGGHVRAERLAGDRLAARLAVDRDHRHAPVALARDAPVGPRGGHVADPLAAPDRDAAHQLDVGERAPAELAALHADEPLLGGAEH